MKDFFGREIFVGDIVAFNEPGYKNLTKGEVLKLNKKQLRLKYQSSCSNKFMETNEYPFDCVKEVI